MQGVGVISYRADSLEAAREFARDGSVARVFTILIALNKSSIPRYLPIALVT